MSIYRGGAIFLPMIDVTLSKENALPNDLWGYVERTWRPEGLNTASRLPAGMEKRGPTTAANAST